MMGDAEQIRRYRELTARLRELRDTFVRLQKKTQTVMSHAVARRDARKLAELRKTLKP